MADYNMVQCVFDRSALSPNEDVAVITMHVRAVTAAFPDVLPMNDVARGEFHGNLLTWWGSVKQYMDAKTSFREVRYYDVPAVAGQDMGDAVAIIGVNEAGTGSSGPLPPQVAVSVTFRTDKRRTWGRFYLPSPTRAMCDNTGRLDGAAADAILGATHGLTSRSGTGAALTVFSRKEWTHHDPELVQVDDIFDVIRSRRFREPHFRKTLSAG